MARKPDNAVRRAAIVVRFCGSSIYGGLLQAWNVSSIVQRHGFLRYTVSKPATRFVMQKTSVPRPPQRYSTAFTRTFRSGPLCIQILADRPLRCRPKVLTTFAGTYWTKPNAMKAEYRLPCLHPQLKSTAITLVEVPHEFYASCILSLIEPTCRPKS